MRELLLGCATLCVALLAGAGASAAQSHRRGHIDRGERRELRADRREIRIIHGKGTGAVRERVVELLRKETRAKSFRMGLWNEGGAGVTVVELE